MGDVLIDSHGGVPEKFKDNGDGSFSRVVALASGTVSMSAGDIEIGAVEIKNDTDDTRVKVTANNAMKVAPTGNAVSTSSISGTITAGGTAQQIAAANANRQGFMLQNQSSDDLYFTTLTTAVMGQPSFRIEPGQTYESAAHGVPAGAISIIGGTTGQAFAGREW